MTDPQPPAIPQPAPPAGGFAPGELERLDEADAVRRLRIIEALDQGIERCRHQRLPLREAMGELLPICCERLGALGVLLRGYDEQLEPRTFQAGRFEWHWAAAVPEIAAMAAAGDEGPDRVVPLEGATVITRVLDCNGEVFGLLAVAYPPDLGEGPLERLRGELRSAAETLDNFLDAIGAAARKHRLAVSASQALRSAVFEEGADQAVGLLSRELDLAGALLVYTEAEGPERRVKRYRAYRDGRPFAASDQPDDAIEGLIRSADDQDLIDDQAAAAVLGGQGIVKTQLINGLSQAPIGKLLVCGRRQGGLDPEGTDVVHLFAESLSQRLVDYNRERRVLSAAFAPAVVTRLLREPNKFQRYLSPRVSEVAILFTDIVSFTSICERVLKDANRIGQLIDRWAEGAIDAIFRHGGVFDKLVGDCAIGLFGPPFYDGTVADYAFGAVRAAFDIAEHTRVLGEMLRLDERIQAAGLGDGLALATGINVGPTSVGFFGPNNDYTGFSSAMNQAARLQGLAGRSEVLVSAEVEARLHERAAAEGFVLEGPRQAKVKNVRDPLSYYAIRRREPEAEPAPGAQGA